MDTGLNISEAVEFCPVCGGDGSFDVTGNSSELEPNIGINMYACVDCDTVYHNPRMTSEAMDEYYSSGVFRETHETSSASEKDRADRLMTVFEMYRLAPERCLDVGSSRGWLLHRLHEKYDCEVVGLDLYVDPAATVQPIKDKRDVTGKFDLITCVHTLEHFHDPMKELEWMASKLEEGGTILIEIPMVKKIIHPHPVLFSKKSIPLLMEHIGLDYDYVDMASHIGIIVAYTKDKKNSAEFYDDIYSSRPEKWSNVQRDMFAYKSLRKHCPDPQFILDYGCGNGHTLKYLQDMFPKGLICTGVDISKIALKLAKWNIPRGEFSTSIPILGSWDIITIMGVAEHFEKPVEQLREIGEHLFDGGLLYLEVPNCLGDSDDEGFRVTNGGVGQHEWHWKRSTWEKAIDDAGFRVVENLEGDSELWQFIWILTRQRKAIYGKSDADLLGLRNE